MSTRVLKATKNDFFGSTRSQKDELLSWVKKHREILSQHQLIANRNNREINF